MIELTQAEVAAYADVGETYPHRRKYLALSRRYAALWEHSRTSDMRGRRHEIATLCPRMVEIGMGMGDAYYVAMWRRRAHLHLCGDADAVYRATDALKWGRPCGGRWTGTPC